MQSTYFSSNSRFIAYVRNSGNEYLIVRSDDAESIGWVRLYVSKSPFGTWKLDPLLVTLTQTDLMMLSMLIGQIKEDHDNDIDKLQQIDEI